MITGASYDASSDFTGNTYFVHGTSTNLAMAEYVYAYIASLLPVLWEEHKRARSLRGNRARLEFFQGVVHGFRKRLEDEERTRVASEHALIWRGDPSLTEFYRWHHPRIRTVYGSGRTRGEAYGAGHEAGGRVTLRRPLTSESGDFGGYIEG